MSSLCWSKQMLLLVMAFVVTATATQVMRQPADYKEPPSLFQSETHPTPTIIHKRTTDKVQMGYFTNWGIYGPNFQPSDITTSKLTHILYAFADIAANGSAILTDIFADEQKIFPGDDPSEPGKNLFGCLGQMYKLKLAQRNLKVLLSIGGGTNSQDGHFDFVIDAGLRAAFVTSVVSLISNYGFDGIDLDFEYPATAAQGAGFADLFMELRVAFDNLAASNGDTTPYQLTAAVNAATYNNQYFVVPQTDSALTYWNIMGYDYSGPWIAWTDNQANVYGGARTGISGDSAVNHLVGAGATVSKMVLGMPLYGRAFEKTAGLGQPYNGIGPGTLSPGIYSYNALPLAGAQVFENTTDISSYSYNSQSKEFVTYDTPDIVKLKAGYINSKGLAGAMYWELSTDKMGTNSIVGTVASAFGTLDQTQNHIHYPNSEWDNIRTNMGITTGASKD